MKGFGADAGTLIAQFKTAGTKTLPTVSFPTAIAPPPTLVVPSTPGVVPEVIPLSDPRHPQHEVWLAMQQHSSPSWYSAFGEFMAGTFGPLAPVVEIGGAILLVGAGWYFLRRKTGVAP